MHDKFVALINEEKIANAYVLLDAYYSNRKIFCGLLESGNHTVSRMRINTVAFEQPKLREGRADLKSRAKKLSFREYLKTKITGKNSKWHFIMMLKPTKNICHSGRMMRFVLVTHPIKGKAILATTELALNTSESYLTSLCRVCLRINGLYFFFSNRSGWV